MSNPPFSLELYPFIQISSILLVSPGLVQYISQQVGNTIVSVRPSKQLTGNETGLPPWQFWMS